MRPDHHVLVQTNGGVWLANMHGHADHNRPAQIHDVMKAMTQQSHDFLSALADTGWTDAEVQETARLWGVLDADYKGWLAEQKKEGGAVERDPNEAPETWLYAAQVSAMIEDHGCLTNGWIISATDEELADYRVIIEEECRECLRVLMQEADPNRPRYQRAHVDLYRKASFLWQARRRLGEI